jgi:hypothetical protein
MKKNKLLFAITIAIVFPFSVFAGSKQESIDSFLKMLEDSGSVLHENKLIKNQPTNRFVTNVKLQGLNKVTGRTFEMESEIGKSINFERLEIVPLKCWKSYPEENTENKLLLKIFETETKSKKKKMIFYGWIFSSSPSVSGLEHSLYDIKLEDCYNKN